MYIVVSYDIHDNKRRNHIHKALKNYGVWVQYSVFECELTREQLLRMQHKLKSHIKESDQDSIRFYHLCDTCKVKINRIGGVVPQQDGPVVV